MDQRMLDLWRMRPDAAVRAARRGEPLAEQALANMPLETRREAEDIVDRQEIDQAFASDLVAVPGSTGRLMILSGAEACCQACAEGRACEGTVGACCEACAQGRACEGSKAQPAAVGASDDSLYGCPPGMHLEPTPQAIPNRFICAFDQGPEEVPATYLGETGGSGGETPSWSLSTMVGVAGLSVLAAGLVLFFVSDSSDAKTR
jgi:hypothetical protein